MTHRVEGFLVCGLIALALSVLYLEQDRLGVWSGLFTGIFLFWQVIAYDTRWYRGVDRKWYRNW